MALADLILRSGYVTGREDLLNEFYIPCLSAATRYDRAVGYFRSTLYVIAGMAFSNFAQRGGKCRLVCSPELTPEDMNAISRGLSMKARLQLGIDLELRMILEDPRNRPIAELLATLVALDILETRFAVRSTQRGIFHDREGQ